MFSDGPPLLPILDAVGIWKDADIRKIEAARGNVERRFPQIKWRICAVNLPAETSLPLFGFWLLNACPLNPEETPSDRSWTILLLIDIRSGQASITPGYAAESCLSDDEWQKVLNSMATYWQAGKTAKAVVRFFKSSRSELQTAWKRYKPRRSHR